MPMNEQITQDLNLAVNALVQVRNAVAAEFAGQPGGQEAQQMLDDALGLISGAKQHIDGAGQQPGQPAVPSAPTTPAATGGGGAAPGQPVG